MDNNDFIRFPFRHILLAGIAVLFFAATAHAQTLSLMPPSIADVNGALKARFGVSVVEKPILKGELMDGAVLVLKCDIALFKVRDYWLDTTLSSAYFESTLKYDRLAGEFVMTLTGRNAPLRNPDLDKLLLAGWGAIETTLGPWNMLEKGEEYSLRLVTGINDAEAPAGLSRFLYFWSWDAGTDNTFHLNFTF